MDINIGNRIKYTFPDPDAMTNRTATGIVESIGEFYVVMITDDNVRIKIHFKNFDAIGLLDQTGKMDLPEAV